MPTQILMPALSPTMEEGTLAKWLVKEGDTVASGDILAEIETDKATMEFEAVDEGTIAKILIAEGSEGVRVNEPIAILAEEGEDVSEAAASGPKTPAQSAAPAPSESAPSPTPSPEAAPAPQASPAPTSNGDGRLRASPVAARMAAQAGIDLSSIAGSGPHGRIIKRDVEAALTSGEAPQSAAPAQSGSQALTVSRPSAPAVRDPRGMGIEEGSYDLVPLDGMKKTIARRMTDSFRDIPHFPLTIDLEIDTLLETRKRVNARLADQGIKVSVNDFVIRAAALGLMKCPDTNASYSTDGILYHHHADIAIAVAIDGGLITPIIRKAETKGLSQIANEMKDLATRARDRKLMPEEYSGGTFSISNLGMFGIKTFASIINEPHGAIMSVGAGEQRPVVKDGALTVATVMSVTLTCDHRVVDGATGSRFLQEFKALIEDPELMLL